MQTMPIGQSNAAGVLHAAHLPHAEQVSAILASPSELMVAAAKTSASHEASRNIYAELDAMLISEPKLGAAQGLRAALLFNGGVALCAMMAWELWTLLVT